MADPGQSSRSITCRRVGGVKWAVHWRQLPDSISISSTERTPRRSSEQEQKTFKRSTRSLVDGCAGSTSLAYIRHVVNMVEDVHTSISNVKETLLGDIGILTCWIEQDYTLEGKAQHVSAPTTVVFRREGNAWKVGLFHSLPLPPEEK